MDERSRSRFRRTIRIAILAAAIVALAAVSVSLAAFGALGLALGWLARRIRDARTSRSARGLEAPAGPSRSGVARVAAIAGAVAALVLLAQGTQLGQRSDSPPSLDPVPRTVVTARYVARASYRDGALVLDERLAVTRERVAAIAEILARGGAGVGAPDEPERLVAARLEAAGLELVEVVDAALVARFPERVLPISESWWSLRASLDLDVPTVDLGSVFLGPDADSFLSLVAPSRLVARTSPPAGRVDVLPGGEESRQIELGASYAPAESIALELRGPLARMPVVGEALETSPSDAVWWIVGILVAYFRDRLAALVRSTADRLLRRGRRRDPRAAPTGA